MQNAGKKQPPLRIGLNVGVVERTTVLTVQLTMSPTKKEFIRSKKTGGQMQRRGVLKTGKERSAHSAIPLFPGFILLTFKMNIDLKCPVCKIPGIPVTG